MEIDNEHERWMRRCLELAQRGTGRVSPNPLVGSVLVAPDGSLLGEGWHEAFGGPHAERNAVADVLSRHDETVLREATLYVNLEPCSHHGKTPPCADLILDTGIPRVVVGMVDPFPAVAGTGIARLRDRGVDVTVGVLEKACRRLNEAFVRHLLTGRPLVTLKIAQTLDGRVATASGDSRWVSGPDARQLVHRWRAWVDGVLVGRGTALADDPALTVRHVEGRQPVRIVLDREGTLPPHLRLFTDGFAARTVVAAGEAARPAYAQALEAVGGRILTVPQRDGHLDLVALLDLLGREGGRDGGALQSVMVEAGPGLATALLRQDLVDRLCLFVAPKLVGGDGLPTFGMLGVGQMEAAAGFAETTWEMVGQDLLFTGYRREA